ncbi:MAG: hypothetical protein ACYDEJ_03440 [Desulfitobacteriaceae bacterium]
MKTTTYICDVCKKSVGEAELCQVESSIKIPRQDHRGAMKLVGCNKDICKDCLIKKGLLIEYSGSDEERSKQVAANQKTFESKFIDFLEDIGVVFVE